MKNIVNGLMIYIAGLMLNFVGINSSADEKSTTPEIEKQIIEIQNKFGFTVVESRCVGDKEDPFEKGALMPGGPFYGQCIDAENNRPPFVLNPQFNASSNLLNSIEFSNNNTIEVANIRHANQWWIGEIDLEAVDKVYYNIVEFRSAYPGIRNDHVELRFVFKKEKPIQLRSQVVTTNKRETLDDLVISHNAYGIYGLGFDPYQGVQGRFAVLGRMVSTYDRANEQIVNSHGKVYQIELNLSDSQKNNLLFHAIRRDSLMIGYNWLYHTLFQNCAVLLFDLIDEVVPRPKGVLPFVQSYNAWLGPLQWFYGVNWIAIIPFIRDLIFQPSIDALNARHLVSHWAPTLNVEFRNGEVSLEKTKIHKDSIRHPTHPKIKRVF